MIIQPLPDVARVVIDGEKVGVMSWAMDDSNLINVFGEPQGVVPIAHEIAKALGGHFITANGHEERKGEV